MNELRSFRTRDLQNPTYLWIIGDREQLSRSEWKEKDEWVLRMASTIAKAHVQLKLAQVWYNKDLDKRLRRGKEGVKVGDYVWLEVQDGNEKDK